MRPAGAALKPLEQQVKCPFCGETDIKVVDLRDPETGEAIRRRRECLGCGKRFTTYERVQAPPLYVVKKDGRREDFSRPKLLSGLVMASKKTKLALANLELMVAEIENALRSQNITDPRPEPRGRRRRRWPASATSTRSHTFDSLPCIDRSRTPRMRATIEDVLAHPPGTRPDTARRRKRRDTDGRELPLDLGK